ncbi:hypothetical protein LJC61_01495 [Ruminococcaceae bacterium OttesenSCG-928-A16]|nr:hypothetical protein [Ruminococcaceae bacterium OttesenSCG-928-A16]
MPSYRYLRDLKPEDQKPEPPPEYSQKEKAKNWWHYHWGWVAGGVALVALVVYFVVTTLGRTQPDYTIGIVTPFSPPDQLTSQLASSLAPLLPDKNGDGQTVVAIEVYTMAPAAEEGEETSGITAADADPYTQMAGVTRLSATLSSADNFIFLFSPDEAQAYQDIYQILGWPDGRKADEGTDITQLSIAFEDCSTLAGLDLAYTYFDDTPLNGQEYFTGYRVGLRAIAGTSIETKKNALENWQSDHEIFTLLTQ